MIAGLGLGAAHINDLREGIMPWYTDTEYDEHGNPIPILKYSALMPGMGGPLDCQPAYRDVAKENKEFLSWMSAIEDHPHTDAELLFSTRLRSRLRRIYRRFF
jgi:hypothetical protein